MHHLDRLEQVVKGMGMTYIYADLYDINVTLDKVKDINFPVFICIAPSKKENIVGVERTLSPNIKMRVPIAGFIMYSVPGQSTSDFEYTKVKAYIRQAEQAADRLIHLLQDDNLTDPESGGIENYFVQDAYSEFDAALFGCNLTFVWPIDELKRGCA